jgi:hypothetical protein
MPDSIAGSARSGCSAGGSAWSNPGSKMLAGEAPPPALRPLQPAHDINTAGIAASRRNFQYNLTGTEYKMDYGKRNLYFGLMWHIFTKLPIWTVECRQGRSADLRSAVSQASGLQGHVNAQGFPGSKPELDAAQLPAKTGIPANPLPFVSPPPLNPPGFRRAGNRPRRFGGGGAAGLPPGRHTLSKGTA